MPTERCLVCMKPLSTGTNRCPHCGSPVPCTPNPPEALQPGYILAGRFTIGRVISRSRFGITYIAYDNRLETTRCIREYFPQNYNRAPDMTPEVPIEKNREFEKYADHFAKGARIMSNMSEDNVSNVVDVFDQLELNGTTYVLMEYLDGCTMDEWIMRTRKGLGWKETRRVMQAVLQALEEIHRHGYLHRNLSLSNIFRMKDGSIRIIDFGSAEPISMAKNEPDKLWPSSKRYYSPEEQVENKAQGPWSDVYAAGACMFRMLTGGWPANQRNTTPFPSVRSFGVKAPEAADRIIGRATQPDPKKRYPSAAAMLDALSKASDEEKAQPVPDRPDPSRTRKAVPVQPPAPQLKQQEKQKPARKALEKAAIVVIILALTAAIAAGILLIRGGGNGGGATPSPAPAVTPTPAP